MTRVEINPNVLTWALKRSGDIERVEKRCPKLQEWRRGESSPTMNQLAQLALATYTPLGYFFLSKPPDVVLPIPYYRTQGDQGPGGPSQNLIDTVQTMEQRQDWLRDYLVSEGEEPLGFVGSARAKEEPEKIAERIRSELGLTALWASKQPNWTEALTYLKLKVEAIGVLVVANGIVGNNTHRKLDPSEFRGFVLVDKFAPLIFINGADSKAAQMFTIAHELAHIWIGRSAAFDLRNLESATDETEQSCNSIAAEFLVPEHLIKEIWPTAKQHPQPFEFVARHFKVSQLVAARRALDLGLVSKAQFFAFYREYMDVEKLAATTQGGGDFYATQNGRLGRRFAEAVTRAAKEGKLLYREAYQLTGLHGKTFDNYAERLRGLPTRG